MDTNINSNISVFKNKFFYVFVSVFILLAFSIWWIYISSFGIESTEQARQIWAASYQIMAILGGIIGIIISRHWGGYKSILGKTILSFSFGLFLQSFGQTIYSYYIFKGIEVPYPSIGDIGFFGSIIFYIIGAFLLARLSGLKFSFQSLKGKLLTLLIPFVILFFSYFFFLKGYEFDWSDKLRIFLDFGYPFGQAIYVSVAILAWVVSINTLGGFMKKPILFLIFALVFQYFSDFMFLYQAYNETWYVGGFNDYLYFISYFIMTISIIKLGATFEKIKNTN